MRRCHDLVARTENRSQGNELCRLPGGERESADPAFERGDPFFEGGGRRVHDPGVDIPKPLQREKLGGVVGVLKYIRGCLVDRHRASAGDRVGPLPSVNRECIEAENVILAFDLIRRVSPRWGEVARRAGGGVPVRSRRVTVVLIHCSAPKLVRPRTRSR